MGSGESAAFLAAAPRTHRRLIVYIASKLRDDGALHRGGPPKSQKPTTPARCSISTLRFFPDSPKHKKAQQGLGTASGVVVFLRDLGFNSESATRPARRGEVVLMALHPCKPDRHVRWLAMVQVVIRYSLSPFRDWLNRDYGLTTRADGKRMC